MPPIPPSRSPSLASVLDNTKAVENAAQDTAASLEGVVQAIADATKALSSLKGLEKGVESLTDANEAQAEAAEALTETLEDFGEAVGDGSESLTEFSKELAKSQTKIQRFTKEAAASFGKLSKRALEAVNDAVRDMPGTRGIGPSAFGASHIDRGIAMAQGKLAGLGKGKFAASLAEKGAVGRFAAGALGKLAGGPAVMAVELATRTALAGINAQREAAVLATQRTLNYGISRGTLEEELTSVNHALAQASIAAAKFNGDLDATRSVISRVATQTGASFDDVGNNIERLEKMRFVGLGSIEELADTLTERMNTTGQTMSQALTEMEGVANEAAQIRAQSNDNFVISMDDFYKAVVNVSEGADALTTSQIGLSKAMRLGLTAADKLNLSYNRAIKGAQGLTQAFVSNYNEGFSIVEVYDDLKEAMKAGGETGERAKAIAEDLKQGRITEMTAARFLKESGYFTTEEGFLSRAKRVAQGMAAGEGAEVIQARIGNVSGDVWELLKQIGPEVLKGNVKTLKEVLPTSEAAKAGLEKVTGQLAKAQVDPTKIVEASLGQLTAAAAAAMEGPFSLVTKLLGPMSKLAEGLLNSFWFKRATGAKDEDVAREEEEKAKANKRMKEERLNYLKQDITGSKEDASRIIEMGLPADQTSQLLEFNRMKTKERTARQREVETEKEIAKKLRAEETLSPLAAIKAGRESVRPNAAARAMVTPEQAARTAATAAASTPSAIAPQVNGRGVIKTGRTLSNDTVQGTLEVTIDMAAIKTAANMRQEDQINSASRGRP